MSKYDDPEFFNEYAKMPRSRYGLDGADEWREYRQMLPDFKDKRVLDLGCGYGLHSVYAVENGAKSVVGIDNSERMLEEARRRDPPPKVKFEKTGIEAIDYPRDSFDVAISSLAFHYVKSFDKICERVESCLVEGGSFVFSVENPIFTASETGGWHYDKDGKILHWPVDNYFSEGRIDPTFLGIQITKYHTMFSTYINTLIRYGFIITKVVEPIPEMELPDESRRPIKMLISATKGPRPSAVRS